MSRVLAVLIRLDALEERLDAKRKAAPGQLDLFGSGAGGSDATGTNAVAASAPAFGFTPDPPPVW